MSHPTLFRRSVLMPLAASALFLSGCVWQSEYDALDAQYKQLQSQSAAQKAADDQKIASLNNQVNRLQGAIKYTVNSDLLFRSGSWEMSKDGQEVIAKIASQLAADQVSHLVVNGYTDNVGSRTANLQLSERRALAVKDWLQHKAPTDFPENRFRIHAFGDDDPVASNATADGRAKNRRVEIILSGNQ